MVTHKIVRSSVVLIEAEGRKKIIIQSYPESSKLPHFTNGYKFFWRKLNFYVILLGGGGII